MSTPTSENTPLTTNATDDTPSSTRYDIVITCADGLEAPLQTELSHMDIVSDIKSTGRLSVSATLEQVYRICLWSRVASRVLLPLKKRNINKEYDVAEQLNGLAKTIDWTQWFGLDNTFAIRMSVDKRVQVSQQFAMLRIKDAIADTFTEKLDARPDVDSNHPDFPIYATVNDKQAEIFLDLSGTSLHRRGYRVAMTDAPLKENLAAGLLYSVGWHKTKNSYSALIDPMCGSGTFIIEALLMQCDYAVGIDKAESQFGFYHWHEHNSELWQQCVNEAQQRFHTGLEKAASGKLPTIMGFDADAGAIKATHKNLIAAGLIEIIPHLTLEQRPLSQLKIALAKPLLDRKLKRPLVITNPPYGERLGESDFIKPLYQGLGLTLKEIFAKQKYQPILGLLAAHVEQADVLPIEDPQTLRCHNGAITVYFRHGQLIRKEGESLITRFEKTEIKVDEAQDFVNRLQKNVNHLKKLAAKEDVTNLRVYDADLPDYKVAIDVYGDYVHVQEWAPPKSIPPETARKRFNLALMGIREVFGINREQIFIKTRARQVGNTQYGNPEASAQSKESKNAPELKKDNRNRYKGNKFQQAREEAKRQEAQRLAQKKRKMHVVQEDGAYFYVNFTDYLDTGLFIDHRNMRSMIRSASRGADVLNLFAYTCTASVHAALGGAKSVTSVDLSQNYLDWGKQNFALNGLDVTTSRYQFIASDIFDWIKDNTDQFDVIFIDPPTFSNSKKFQGTFDVQRDHTALINRAMNRLANGGVIYFSNNFTKFELDETLYDRYEVTEITSETIGFDFNPKKPIHHSFEIRHKL
ncbi:bifunctional 23S rRNA (guanine(2069)-N(7))-methyltransferase RlmK/23S rRNA (guanine(2445)-N(2))-methyltransferase RlmL [Psychrobacter raelei]|uniref:Ribosomal RNA large subunit methyltransferase K/L n=1 Tax=Psychrobacter raelei TaxID=2565531 RepID=A0AAU6PU96_9GAMM